MGLLNPRTHLINPNVALEKVSEDLKLLSVMVFISTLYNKSYPAKLAIENIHHT